MNIARLHLAVATIVILGFGVNLCDGHKHWSEYEDCDRDKIVHEFRQACITFKRSANFFQPQYSRSVTGLDLESEEDAEDTETLLMGRLSPRFPRHMKYHFEGQEGRKVRIERSVAHSSPGKILSNLLLLTDVASNHLKQKRRHSRDVALLTELIFKCCSERCTASDFLPFDEKYRYCDTLM